MKQPWYSILSGVAALVSAAALVVAVPSATVLDDRASTVKPATPAARSAIKAGLQASCPDADTVPLPRSAFPADRGGTASYIQNKTSVPRAVLCLVNAERAAQGIPALIKYTWLRGTPTGLGGAAGQHADESASRPWWGPGKDPHTNPYTGSTPASRIAAAGYCRSPKTLVLISENTYTGWGASSSTPRAAVNWWMGSAPHRATILNPQLQETGIGVAVGSADPSAGSITPAATYVQTFGTCSS